MKKLLWVALLVGCTSLSIETIETCSMSSEEFMGVSILTKINCSSRKQALKHGLTESEEFWQDVEEMQLERRKKLKAEDEALIEYLKETQEKDYRLEALELQEKVEEILEE